MGAALGGNASVIGASSNIVAQGLAQEAGYRFGFGRFFRFGLPITAISGTIAAGYLVVRWLLRG
jgi:Na+/H+ antiporter NhaD/arsenite permease-like protein